MIRVGLDPAESFDNEFAVVEALNAAGAARADTSDANHFLYLDLVKANQLFVTGQPDGEPWAGLMEINVPVMIIHTDEDLVFPGNSVRETAAMIRAGGAEVEMVELEGTQGHLDGVLGIAQAGERIRAFMEREAP